VGKRELVCVRESVCVGMCGNVCQRESFFFCMCVRERLDAERGKLIMQVCVWERES